MPTIKKQKKVLNLGQGGAGSLLEYATIREYLPIKTIDKVPRPEYREELVRSVDETVFKVKYRIMNRALLSQVPQKGSGTVQPYASCVGISGPTGTLSSAHAKENLKKGFYRATGLRLRDLEEVLS